jgi:hypothetical protein
VDVAHLVGDNLQHLGCAGGLVEHHIVGGATLHPAHGPTLVGIYRGRANPTVGAGEVVDVLLGVLSGAEVDIDTTQAEHVLPLTDDSLDLGIHVIRQGDTPLKLDKRVLLVLLLSSLL